MTPQKAFICKFDCFKLQQENKRLNEAFDGLHKLKDNLEKSYRKQIVELVAENNRLADMVIPTGKNLTVLQLRQQIDILKVENERLKKELDDLKNNCEFRCGYKKGE
jgi:hypothetical protein